MRLRLRRRTHGVSLSTDRTSQLQEEWLTAVRIVWCVVDHVADIAVDRPLGRDVRYLGRDAGPQGLALGVVREQLRGLPYWGEVLELLGDGSEIVWLALESGICKRRTQE